MSQLPLPLDNDRLYVRRVDVYIKGDNKTIMQSRFHQDLSIWLSFPSAYAELKLLNIMVTSPNEEGQRFVTVSQGSVALFKFMIDPNGVIHPIKDK